jgi:hypothetical protein
MRRPSLVSHCAGGPIRLRRFRLTFVSDTFKEV